MEKNNAADAVIDFISGSMGGIALVYVGQPLDTVKVKMQTFPKLYTGMVDCFLKTLRNDGIVRGLYAGSVPAVITNVVENSVLFLCYGICQKTVGMVVKKDVEKLTFVEKGLSASLSAVFVSVAITPTELIKCKMQASFEQQKQLKAKGIEMQRVGPGRLFLNIYKTDGLKGIFHGISATLLREVPGCFVFFAGYEGCRDFFTKEGETKDDIGLAKTLVSGALGGIIYWSLLYPVDLLKSRIQVEKLHIGIGTLFMEMLRKEGVASLYSGVKPTVLRAIPTAAALFTTYEYSKRFLDTLYYG